MDLAPKALPAKWQCSYLAKETDNDFQDLTLKPAPRSAPRAASAAGHRLYSTPTVSFLLRCGRERPPTDSLEHGPPDLGKPRKCFCKPVPGITVRSFDHPLQMAASPETPMNIHYIKLAIECPHTSQTNKGYSRKVENGNFYRS